MLHNQVWSVDLAPYPSVSLDQVAGWATFRATGDMHDEA